MRFTNESCVEDYVRRMISEHITSINKNIFALESKTIADVVICRNSSPAAIFFLEVKYYQPANGRIGVGNSCGKGIQPEVLKRRPAYLESNLRWLICNAEMDNLFWLVTTKTLCPSFLSGGTIGPKQNNIKSRLFEDVPGLCEDELLCEIRYWLES